MTGKGKIFLGSRILCELPATYRANKLAAFAQEYVTFLKDLGFNRSATETLCRICFRELRV